MIRWFAAHPTAANLLMGVFLALGIASLGDLRRETFPAFTVEAVRIRVPYPGGSAEEVEAGVCQRIEEVLESVAHVEEIRSEAREGVGIVTVDMVEGQDFPSFVDAVESELDALDDLPDLAEDPVLERLGMEDRVISVAVTGLEDPSRLKAYAEEVRAGLRGLRGVSTVELQGFSEHQLRVEVPELTVRQYGIGVEEVARAIAQQSIEVPAGTLETRDRELLVRFADERVTPGQLAGVVVRSSASGGELTLGELATISDAFEREEAKIDFDGQRAAILQVEKAREDDTLSVRRAVEDYIATQRALAPPGVALTLTEDVSAIVRDRLDMLVTNGWQGLLLVFVVMGGFFSTRFAFWVVMGLPVSFLGAFALFGPLGQSINMITMIALLLGLGLLMDDAIVIAENVARLLREGRSPLDAAVEGTRQVLPGVLSSFATTLCVFVPLLQLQGNIGRVLHVMPIVLIVVLTISLVEAFWVLPNHLAHAMHHMDPSRPSRARARLDAWVDLARERVLGRAVDAAVGARYLVFGSVLGVFLLSIGWLAGGRLKFQAFPDTEGDVVEARVLLPQGTPLARTEAVVAQLTDALERVETGLGGAAEASLVQHVSVRYDRNPDAFESGPHVASVVVDLLPSEQRRSSVDEVIARWRHEVGPVADVLHLKFTEPAVGPAGRAIDVRLRGERLDDLRAAALDTRRWFERVIGVTDLGEDLRPGKPEVRIRLRPGATALGVDAQGVANQVRAALRGVEAQQVQLDGEDFEVRVRLSLADRDTRARLSQLPIRLPSGEVTALETLATLDEARGWARISRIDGQRAVSIQGDVDTQRANTEEVLAAFSAEALPELEASYPGVTVEFGGEAEQSDLTARSMERGFVLGLLGVFALLSLQFRSYVEPLVVMVAIPFALIGVIWGHWAIGLPLSMPSMLGFVSLAGIVVNDSILLVQFVKWRAAEGISVEAAVRQASRDRFRAILITSLTTIAGLLPLLFERSRQAQVLIPLTTSLVFGMLASTVLVLVVIPSLYAILDDLGLARPR